MSELLNRVNESSDFYNRSFLNFDYQLAEYSFQTFKPFLKGDLALELGPASGFMTKQLLEHFKEIHLVEGSKNLLDQISDFPNIVKYCSLFENFETSIQFDTIIMSHVMEHILDPYFILNKIYDWLKSDGVLLVSVPNAKSLHRLVAVEMGLLNNEYELNKRDEELGHYRVYDLEMLRSQVEKAGFNIIKSGGYFFKPLSNLQIEKTWDQNMINGFYKVGRYFQENCAEIFVICNK